MRSEEERQKATISYEKPTAVDLGPTAPVVGQSCTDGLEIETATCLDVGNGAFDSCGVGLSASNVCIDSGSSPGNLCVSVGSDL